MRVLVVGAGLIGSSVALALREAGGQVQVLDADALRTQQVSELTGLSVHEHGVEPDVVVVAVPPQATAAVVIENLRLHPKATVIDVTSIKADVAVEVDTSFSHAGRYVPTHPMAGKETSGAGSATYDLFADRLWVICPSTDIEHTQRAHDLARACGAVTLEMSPAEHDRTVALTSHLPQLVSSALASQLLELAESEVAVSGQGLRDMTRIAASPAGLWTEILLANRTNLQRALQGMQQALASAEAALAAGDGQRIAALMGEGNRGRALLPGKHGAEPRPYATVAILINDQPGQLAAIFACAGRGGINVEDVRIDHALGRMVAVIELDVVPEQAAKLAELLVAEGWTLRHSIDAD